MLWTLLAVLLLLNVASFPGMYHIRTLLVVIRGTRAGRLRRADEETRYSWLVTPDDLDFNIHMNNSSFNKNADFARTYHFTRLMGSALTKYRIANGGVMFRFIKELKPFQPYTIHTRVYSYDAKWLMLRQTYMSGNKVVAVGTSRMVIKEKSGKTIPPLEAFRLFGLQPPADGAIVDDTVRAWSALEDSLGSPTK